MSLLTWLHLSDFHFQEEPYLDQAVILEELLQDIDGQCGEHGLAIDLVFVTGDIAFHGEEGEYQVASLFFKELLARLGLPRDRLFLVPGNHDACWSMVGKQDLREAKRLLDQEDPEAVARLLRSVDERERFFRRQGHFRGFSTQWGHPGAAFTAEQGWYAVRSGDDLEGRLGRPIWVMGLNSAWLSSGPEDGWQDEGSLLVGQAQILDALKRVGRAAGMKPFVQEGGNGSGPIVVALAHHPLTCLASFDRLLVQQELVSGTEFLLRGHLHLSDEGMNLSCCDGLMEIACGSTFPGFSWRHGYNLVRLDLLRGRGDLWMRTRSQGGWLDDDQLYANAPRGHWSWNLSTGQDLATIANVPDLGNGGVPFSLFVGGKRHILSFSPDPGSGLLQAQETLRANLHPQTGQGPGGLDRALGELGRGLGRALCGPEEFAALELGSEEEPCGAALEAPTHRLSPFWETAVLPGDATEAPLALHPRMLFFRRLSQATARRGAMIPGPLRVLVALSSPDGQGERVDGEREMALLMDSLEQLVMRGEAHVEFLEEGSLEAIHAALRGQGFHALHLVCRAREGHLLMEDREGQERRVSPEELLRAIPAEGKVPLYFLASPLLGQAGEESWQLTEVAEGLSRLGVPAVAVMQGKVSAPYGVDLASRFYHHLAQGGEPLRAMWRARRGLEEERQKRVWMLEQADQPVEEAVYLHGESGGRLVSNLPEWPAPVIYLGGEPEVLFDPSQRERVERPGEVHVFPGEAYGRQAFLVGRRRERRELLSRLRSSSKGVMIHGMGGVGKSLLAAHLMERLQGQGWIPLPMTGMVGADRVLHQVGQHFARWGMKAREESFEGQSRAFFTMARLLTSEQIPYASRLSFFEGQVLSQIPLLLVMDNFEDNLEGGGAGPLMLRDKDLAQALSRWLTNPLSRLRVIIASRYPFVLPGEESEPLSSLELRPLSLSEGRRMMLRLPGLKGLDPREHRMALNETGGHPRTLECLDALMRQGRSYAEISQALATALAGRGLSIQELAHEHQGLDPQVGEAVAQAAGEAILENLLALLDRGSPEWRLLFGSAVMRHPLPLDALEGQAVAVEELELPDKAREMWDQAQAGSLEVDATTLKWQLLHTQETRKDVRQALEVAAGRLIDLSLLTSLRADDTTDPAYLVHRWTAQALQGRLTSQELADLHRRAASFWELQVRREVGLIHSQALKSHHVEMLLEAKHHRLKSGDLAGAYELVQVLCLHLHMVGDHGREEGILREAADWFGEETRERAVIYHHLGVIAEARGEWEQSENWYRSCLVRFERLEDRQGIASSYHQLGRVAQEQGHAEQAEALFLKSLEIFEDLGDSQGMVTSYHNLGNIAYLRGQEDQAEEWHQKCLAIFQSMGDMRGMAGSYHQLGRIAHMRRQWDRAEEWYKKSLELFQEIGEPQGIARGMGQMGVLLFEQERPKEALAMLSQSLALHLELGSPNVMIDLHWLAKCKLRLGDQAFFAIFQEVTGHPWPEGLNLPEVEE